MRKQSWVSAISSNPFAESKRHSVLPHSTRGTGAVTERKQNEQGNSRATCSAGGSGAPNSIPFLFSFPHGNVEGAGATNEK